mmetsp:Transcript_55396/g.160856  ORF Transcript_55396/g.160856 Transcript_55396/m.160856 type:complete len:237 (-) Transcript_55396:1094-1804(-)
MRNDVGLLFAGRFVLGLLLHLLLRPQLCSLVLLGADRRLCNLAGALGNVGIRGDAVAALRLAVNFAPNFARESTLLRRGFRLGGGAVRLVLHGPASELVTKDAYLLFVGILYPHKAEHLAVLIAQLARQRGGGLWLWWSIHVQRFGQPVKQVLVERQTLQPIQRSPDKALRRHRCVVACEGRPIGLEAVVHKVVRKCLCQHLEALLVERRGPEEERFVVLLHERFGRSLLLHDGLE